MYWGWAIPSSTSLSRSSEWDSALPGSPMQPGLISRIVGSCGTVGASPLVQEAPDVHPTPPDLPAVPLLCALQLSGGLLTWPTQWPDVPILALPGSQCQLVGAACEWHPDRAVSESELGPLAQ
jgi:hypothetical protein